MSFFKQFNRLNIPDGWEQYWSKYPEGYTILEALIDWVSQVDDMVKNVNDWNKFLDDFVESFDSNLRETVTTIIREWQESGLLGEIISEALQTQIDDVEQHLGELAPNVKMFGAKGDGVTDDNEAIQFVLDTFKGAYIPDGDFITKKPLLLKYDDMVIEGNGLRSAIVAGDKSFPVFQVTANRFSNLVMRAFTLRNGSYGIYKESGGIMERASLERIWFEFQSVCGISIKAPAQFMVNNLIDVVFRYSTGGIFLSGGASNLNTYTRCRFEGLDAPSFRMSNETLGSTELGGSANYFLYCRFEAHNSDIQGYNPIELLNGDFNTKFDGCYFENIITPCIIVNTYPQNSRLFHITDSHFSGNTPRGPLIQFSAGIRGAIIENNHMANDGGNGSIEGATLSSDICIRNNQYLTSVNGFPNDAFTFNDIGKKINKDIELFDRKYFHTTRAGLKMTDAVGVSTVETDDQGNISLRPLGVERAKITKDGFLSLPSAGRGIEILSPNGTKYKLTVTDAGSINITV